MSGEIIDLRSHRRFRQGGLRGKDARPENPPRPAEPAVLGDRVRTLQSVERQLVRIARLLEDLEVLARSSAAFREESEVNPQPEIDHEKLDRLYGDLNADA
jgi:hypothetical protein